MTNVMDFDARKQAIDISASYAVQAPAGSGKTELLSLRFLHLLAVSQQPEEVLAITFTKKAANEMAERILSTLDWAASKELSDLNSQFDIDRYNAADKVLQQDKARSWKLRESPHRLRIQTIDSFSSFLANRLPVLSNFGGPLLVSDQIDDCYQEAIRDCLDSLNDESAIAEHIAELLLHFDNDVEKVEGLLLDLLKNRDQWIETIIDIARSPKDALNHLIKNIDELIEESLLKAKNLLLPYENSIVDLLRYATKNLKTVEKPSIISRCEGLDELPGMQAEDLAQWRGLLSLLLTNDVAKPSWRKRITKEQGFPAPSSSKEFKQLYTDKKQGMEALLGALGELDEGLETLNYLRWLPGINQGDRTWQFLNTLTAILPTLLAQLEIAFARNNKVDYPQVSSAALRALGTDDNPTDLALSLDYQIKHILVDEFQDTSSTQLNLLVKLTAGWEADDGRTLFVVGDAMQSCYSFRNADVGLFISVRESGIRDIPLLPVDLIANFRSDAGIVNWVNQIFSNAFPSSNNISRGAVLYSHSEAVHPAKIAAPVTTRCYLYEEGDKTRAYVEEAIGMAQEISRLHTSDPNQSIAILVRNRPHLLHILPALRDAEISWQATEIDKLDTLSVITDLLSLTKAVCNQADKLAWLAILRAPWCGLELNDLHCIATADNQLSMLARLQEVSSGINIEGLSAEGLTRIGHITPLLTLAIANKEQLPLNRILRILFLQLGGRSIASSQVELDSVEKYFELIRLSEISGSIENLAEFERNVQSSFVSNSANHRDINPVQIMTIHKSKGLEFDHVFLPGLSRPGRIDDKALMLWHQRLNQSGEPKLFLATLSPTGSKDSSVYDLLKYEKSEKAQYETTRLLYIGVTRAKKSAFLSATLQTKDDETQAPPSRSLLKTIWDSLNSVSQPEYGLSFVSVKTETSTLAARQNPLEIPPLISRLPLSYFSGQEKIALATNDEETPQENLILESQLQKQIGILVHLALQNYIGNKQLFSEENLANIQRQWQHHLSAFGFSDKQISHASEIIERSLLGTVSDEKINWIFSQELQQSAAELAMQTLYHGYLRTHILDRTFIDDEGYRWIIDYKSSQKPNNQPQEVFVEQQLNQYSDQLNRYRSLFANESNKGIKTALLFTSLPVLAQSTEL